MNFMVAIILLIFVDDEMIQVISPIYSIIVSNIRYGDNAGFSHCC